MRVGLTGGIGSGKSEVARLLASFGAFIIDTDVLARQAVVPNSDGFREIARAWPGVVRGTELDRAALAQIIFHDPAARERLNAIVHPHVRRLASENERYAKPGQLIVQVVPLLFETGYAQRCDATVVVVAPEATRIERLRARAMSEDQIRARMNAQIDPASARALATYAIENDADLATLRERTRDVYDALIGERRESVRLLSSGANGSLRVRRTVYGLTTCVLLSEARLAAVAGDFVAGLSARSKVYFTALASKGSPLEKRTP